MIYHVETVTTYIRQTSRYEYGYLCHYVDGWKTTSSSPFRESLNPVGNPRDAGTWFWPRFHRSLPNCKTHDFSQSIVIEVY